MDPELWIAALVAVVCVTLWTWQRTRGLTVGSVRARQQGEAAVPGAPAVLVVKREIDSTGHAHVVRLQVRVLGTTDVLEIPVGEAKMLAAAVEEAAGWVHGDG